VRKGSEIRIKPAFLSPRLGLTNASIRVSTCVIYVAVVSKNRYTFDGLNRAFKRKDGSTEEGEEDPFSVNQSQSQVSQSISLSPSRNGYGKRNRFISPLPSSDY